MTSAAGEKLIADHLIGGQDRVPRLGYGAMQLAGPGVIGRPDDVAGGIEVLRSCERQDIAFVPFWPLAFGYLGEPETLTRPARRLGVSTSAVALAWLLRRSPVMVPIPGTKSLAHLRDNLGAAGVAARLTGDEIAALTAAGDEESATLGTMPAPMVAALVRAGKRPPADEPSQPGTAEQLS